MGVLKKTFCSIRERMWCVTNKGLICKLACFVIYWGNSILYKKLQFIFNCTLNCFQRLTLPIYCQRCIIMFYVYDRTLGMQTNMIGSSCWVIIFSVCSGFFLHKVHSKTTPMKQLRDHCIASYELVLFNEIKTNNTFVFIYKMDVIRSVKVVLYTRFVAKSIDFNTVEVPV